MKPYKVLDELDSMAPIDCLHRMLQLSSFKIYIDCRNNVCLRCVWITMAPYINSGVNRAFWERMVRKIESYQRKYITRRSVSSSITVFSLIQNEDDYTMWMITEAHILSYRENLKELKLQITSSCCC